MVEGWGWHGTFGTETAATDTMIDVVVMITIMIMTLVRHNNNKTPVQKSSSTMLFRVGTTQQVPSGGCLARRHRCL